MTCTYCGAWNPEVEHRCQRCGRRVSGTVSEVATAGGAAVALARVPAPVIEKADSSIEHSIVPQPLQRQLFVSRQQPKVIPFESLGTPRPQPPRTEEKVRPASPKTESGRRLSATRPPDTQTKLDFLPAAPPASRKLKTTVEAVIFCDAPVAAKVHRSLASFLDASMIVIAFGMFVAGFHLAGGEFAPDRLSITVFGLSLALIAAFYGLIWVLGNGDTPGKRWTRLHLINFDGFPPDRTQRALRLCGFALGVAAGATGLLWALVDEESLAWHDHISKTFLTVHEQDTNFFRQR